MRSAAQLLSGGLSGSARQIGPLLACVLCLIGCDAYDARLLRMPNPSSHLDGGQHDAGHGGLPEGDGGEEDGGGICPNVAEQCNQIDDDCDGRVDEDADRACEMTVLNAEASCGIAADGPRCVLLECHDGFANCDGNPANGCEPYCLCNFCDDAGTEDGGL